MTILPLAYLGNTEWFARLANEECVIDIGENWVKQTARNRAEILTANGVAALTVPVHGSGPKIATRDVRIDNSKRWQHQHWTSLVSAYKNSPFFDHYQERFAPLYTTGKLNYLTDLNLELLNILTVILGIEGRVKISDNYVVASSEDVDLRGKKALRRDNLSGIYGPKNAENVENPKNAENAENNEGRSAFASDDGGTMVLPEYIQVFADRTEFVPGLSVIDLVMCEGPAARRLLTDRRR